MLMWVRLLNLLVFALLLCNMYVMVTEPWAHMYLAGAVPWLVFCGLVFAILQTYDFLVEATLKN